MYQIVICKCLIFNDKINLKYFLIVFVYYCNSIRYEKFFNNFFSKKSLTNEKSCTFVNVNGTINASLQVLWSDENNSYCFGQL